MDDDNRFSFEVRLVIARLGRLVCKFDGERTPLSDEDAVFALIRRASEHPRAEIQSLFDELLYLMTPEELSELSANDVVLPDAYAQMLPDNKREALQPRRVYRGQVMDD